MPQARRAPRGRSGPPDRPLALIAVGSGAVAAAACAVVAIVAVSICWLPAAGTAGNAASAIRAGLLTFLAALHAGITVDGVATSFVPLGMTALVGVIAWRSGAVLAFRVRDLGADDAGVLVRLAMAQAASFAGVCAATAAFATLGTSHVSVAPVAVAGFMLFAIIGGTSFVRASGLAEDLAEVAPDWLAPGARIAAAVTAVYALAGAAVTAGALVVHREQVEVLSREIGGGWSGVPVLLLGILAAPNAVIAGASYLAGPGFAVGSGSDFALDSAAHGTVPAFPMLGGLPHGGATPAVWLLAMLTPVVAGCVVAALARRAGSGVVVWTAALAGVVAAAATSSAFAWLGGGGIGPGRLGVLGASAWQFGLAVGIAVGGVAAVVLGVVEGASALRAHEDANAPTMGLRSVLATIRDSGRVVGGDADGGDDPGEGGKLAG